jgi:hypothetical protein
MNDAKKKSKIDELTHLVLLLAGCVSQLASYFLPSGLKEILSGLGTALLASSFIGFFDKRYLTAEKSDPRKEWGLINIYRKRTETDDELNSRIKTTAEQVDGIVQGGLHSLRNSQDVKLAKRLERGLIMRLLIPKDTPDPRMENANKELEDWYHSLNKDQKKNVFIRKYNEIPQELYFRVDDILIIGPYLAHIDGPRNITYMFDVISKGGKIYSDHFEDLWARSKGEDIR